MAADIDLAEHSETLRRVNGAAPTSDGHALEFTLPGLPKTANAMMRGDWRIRAGNARRWKFAVEVAVAQAKQKLAPEFVKLWPLKHADITYIRCSSQEPDLDGTVTSFKAIQDGLKAAGVIFDDKPSNINSKYLWEYAKIRHGHVKVRVTQTL